MQVTDLDSYKTWLTTTFSDQYFSQNYFGAEPGVASASEIKPYLADLSNLRVGPARLRQVRIRSGKV